jgi:hypothetical protein
MGANVNDFTDLGKGVEFTYKGSKFEIPSYTKSEMTLLMEISEKMVEISKNMSPEDKENLKRDEIKTDELKKLFNIQLEFIICGVRKISSESPGEVKLIPLTLAEVEEWPWRLCNKVNSMIQDMMGTVGEVDNAKASKKNPT